MRAENARCLVFHSLPADNFAEPMDKPMQRRTRLWCRACVDMKSVLAAKFRLRVADSQITQV